MKTGKSIVELANEIQRQADAKKDYVVDTRALEMVSSVAEPEAAGTDLRLDFGDRRLQIGSVAHDQIADHTGVPTKYYRRMMAEAPGLLVSNVNWWMQQKPSKQMIRTLDGNARAFLSDKYRPLDNLELAEAVLPVLGDLGVEIMSAEITEKRLYIKAVDHRLGREIEEAKAAGRSVVRTEMLYPATVITNSEIGFGALSISVGTFNGGCTNLAWLSDRSMRKYHVGQKFGEFTEAQTFALLSDQSRRLNDAALWSSVRDVVKGAFDEAMFEAVVAKIKGTQENEITGDVPKVVEVAAQRFGFNEGERKSVLDHLIRGGDLSQYGLHNAITRTAEDLADYDRATEFERTGGQVLELSANDWRQIAEAA